MATPLWTRLASTCRLSLGPAARRTFATEVKQPLQRGNYKQLAAADVDAFRSMVSNPDASVLTTLDCGQGKRRNGDDLVSFNEDWM
jgi:hypothetical protein